MKRFFLIIAICFVLGGVLRTFFFFREGVPPEERVVVSPGAETPIVTEKKVVEIPVAATPNTKPKLPEKVSIPNVPFTAQAPFGEWQDPMFQDACEEASIIMARAWRFGTPLTKEGVKKEIQALARFQKKEFGHSVDTSIEDTQWLLQEFFAVNTSSVEREVTIESIQEALAAGRVVIIPTDGRKLKNPNFKQPGPSRHMLVIVGYENETKEFIVNEPGTRRGEGYRYDFDVLYGALLDYSTGNHVPATSVDKVMLTVGRD